MGNSVELDANGLNKAVSAVPLDEETMRGLGFTDHVETNWYLCKRVESDITFNLSIPKGGGRLAIDVLDEDFGQPYDYQSLLERNPELTFALGVKEKVENIMTGLSEAGVIHGFVRGMYL